MRARILFVAGALALASATLSLADQWNQKLVITFDRPVSVPAVHQAGYGVLPAGKYVFKVMDSMTNRDIVQIWNEKETEIYATVLAIPNLRLKVTDKAVITFRETPAGHPLALRNIFYPGRESGHEFVYSKAKAIELARETHEPVLSTEIKEEAKPEAPEVIAELEAAPVTPIEPEEVAEAALPPAPAPMPAAPAELPKTASPLPLISLLGMLTLSAGLGLRYATKRTR